VDVGVFLPHFAPGPRKFLPEAQNEYGTGTIPKCMGGVNGPVLFHLPSSLLFERKE